MTTLNKTFQLNQILTAEELNTVVGKINEIVTLLSSLPEVTSGVTDAQVKAKIDEAIGDANRLIDAAILNLQNLITELKNIQEGATQVVTAEEWAQYRKKTSDLETDVAAIKLAYDGIDLVALKQTVDDINSWAGSISIEPGKIEMLAALLDENNELIIKPASIIAAITDDNGKLKSLIVVSADQVILDGDVTLTNGLTAMNGEITNLTSSLAEIRGKITAAEAEIANKATIGQLEAIDAKINNIEVPDTATIKNAVIDDIEAGNVTISGTLRYNQAIGNVQMISDGTGEFVLPDESYYVEISGGFGQDSSTWPIIKLPQHPVTGQTLFIYIGNGAWFLEADQTIMYYALTYDVSSSPQYNIKQQRNAVGQRICPYFVHWNGPVQFIYNGSLWLQIASNITIPLQS